MNGSVIKKIIPRHETDSNPRAIRPDEKGKAQHNLFKDRLEM
jgi:hypothetical protein